jgi:hypothetical protein
VAAASLLAAFKRWNSISVLATVIGSISLYTALNLILWAPRLPFLAEVPLFCGSLVAGALLMRAFVTTLPDKTESVLASFSAVLWIPFSRILWLLLTRAGEDGVSAGIVAIAVSAALIAITSMGVKSMKLATVAAVVAACAAMPFVFLVDGRSSDALWTRNGEIGADLVLLLSVGLVGRAVFLRRPESVAQIVATVLLPFGLIVVRIAYLALVWPPAGWQNVFTVEVASLVFGLATAVLAIMKKWKPVAAVAFTTLVIVLALYPAMKVPEIGLMTPPDHFVTRGETLVVLIGLLALSLTTAKAFVANGTDIRPVLHLSALLNWSLVSGLFIHTLDLPPFRLTFDASVSVAWTFYAAVMLVIGFWANTPVLRYWALAVFGITIAKVVVYDLAFLDPVVKVVVLIGLGIVMLAGGYLYIRSQKGKGPVSI